MPEIELLVGTLLVLIGATLFGVTLRERTIGLQSRDWPCVEGTILRVSTAMHEDEGHLTYYCKVVYQYLVGGRIYSSDQVQPGARSGGSQILAKRWSGRYTPGQTVAVYYHPRNPSVAVLEPKPNPAVPGAFSLAGLLLICGIAILLVATASWISSLA